MFESCDLALFFGTNSSFCSISLLHLFYPLLTFPFTYYQTKLRPFYQALVVMKSSFWTTPFHTFPCTVISGSGTYHLIKGLSIVVPHLMPVLGLFKIPELNRCCAKTDRQQALKMAAFMGTLNQGFDCSTDTFVYLRMNL